MDRRQQETKKPATVLESPWLRDISSILRGVDEHLRHIPAVSQVAHTLNVRPVFVVGLAFLFVSMILGIFDGLITNVVGFLYPAWQSFKVLEATSVEGREAQQWLTYWVVYACFTLVEIFSDTLLFWVPFYYLAKLSFLLWLALPQFQGAFYLYTTVLRPLLLTYEASVDRFLATILGAAYTKTVDSTDKAS